MSADYYPQSDFLNAIIADDVALSGSDFAASNLKRLMAMTRDPEVSNRDWAVLLLGQQEIDTPEVREALLHAAKDKEGIVRAEAIAALARRDPAVALPYIQHELKGECVWMPIFEAAELVADASLIEDLEGFAEPSDDPNMDKCARAALAACQRIQKA